MSARGFGSNGSFGKGHEGDMTENVGRLHDDLFRATVTAFNALYLLDRMQACHDIGVTVEASRVLLGSLTKVPRQPTSAGYTLIH